MGSTNGTYCNGLRVESRELVDGDKILVGSTTILKFTYHDNLDEIFQKQMYESALRDGLTKAFNKKYFTDRLESEFTFSVRHATPLALVLFDIDHFKKVNDTHGHQAGDHVLTEMATLLTATLRAEDVFARYGGEEFAVICRGSDPIQAQVVGERLRKAVEAHSFVYEKTNIPVTISVGIAVLPDPAVKDASDIVSLADQALYKSKHAGRNRVTLHVPG
jgi:diguanylate cyclase (GGDEF)-like protein